MRSKTALMVRSALYATRMMPTRKSVPGSRPGAAGADFFPAMVIPTPWRSPFRFRCSVPRRVCHSRVRLATVRRSPDDFPRSRPSRVLLLVCANRGNFPRPWDLWRNRCRSESWWVCPPSSEGPHKSILLAFAPCGDRRGHNVERIRQPFEGAGPAGWVGTTYHALVAASMGSDVPDSGRGDRGPSGGGAVPRRHAAQPARHPEQWNVVRGIRSLGCRLLHDDRRPWLPKRTCTSAGLLSGLPAGGAGGPRPHRWSSDLQPGRVHRVVVGNGGASILLYGLVDRRFGSRAALVSVVLFCWFPTSCFLLAPYSEALFILEILIVVTLIERGGWWPAALVGGFASATSPEGVVLAIAIVIAALIGCRGLWRTAGYGLASVWGLAAYTVFLGVRFGDPLAYVTEEGNWHRLTRFPFTGIVHNIGSIRHVMDERGPVPAGYRFVRPNIVWAWIVNDAMVVVAAAALVYLVVITVRVRRADTGPRAGVRVPIPWIVILAGVVGIVSVTSIRFAGTLTSSEGDARLISVAFPLSPALYLMPRRWQVAVVILMTASIGAALFVQAMFNLGYWVV